MLTALSIVLALLAGGGNAAANVLQRKASLLQDAHEPFSLGVLARLVRTPVWIGGFGAMVASFLLQALALSIGELSVVEPFVAMELPLTLLLAAWVFGEPLGRREWVNFALMTAGLVLLVASLAPTGGDPGAVPTPTYLVAGGVTAAVVVGFFVASRRGSVLFRTAMLGLAAGTSFGLTATMIKETVDRWDADGFLAILTTWQTYTAVFFGILGVVTVQSALHIGPLIAAQPGFTLMDPLVAVLWGILVFAEQVRTGWFAVAAGFGFALIGVAVVQLSRSPLLAHLNETLAVTEADRLGGVRTG